ncbi:bifunctional 2-polyprenyl-6-hydroxyphenol methylase/3-demethylubiquinol 3-O-methyltransferase UbiG [Aquisalimonas sp.]|uniref:class I SAM-dependent methyltransferase n=1 Tax=unclassified Aquisalimonas TaxID=2644645 RepID=UPI0025BE396E|nr:class I SAM-dependent methyltransferase [Aquisalimonas sp.]
MSRSLDRNPHIAPYSARAEQFFRQYESLRFADAHEQWLHCVPERSGRALDVGAGSGRDARALAEMGWRVTAVEPATGLRELGELATQAVDGVLWLDSALPELEGVTSAGERFDLILLSAVWMHVTPDHRSHAMQRLAELLAPSGLLVITLRHGPAADDRQFYACDRQALKEQALECGLTVHFENSGHDQLGRDGVTWETVVLTRS